MKTQRIFLYTTYIKTLFIRDESIVQNNLADIALVSPYLVAFNDRTGIDRQFIIIG